MPPGAMPTLSAVAFDQLLEPTASESLERATRSSMPVPISKPPNPEPAINLKLERRNGTSHVEGKVQQPRMTPALYATPEVTSLPGSPSSYSPSPYVINHKWRGPRLLKSCSEGGVTTSLNADKEKSSQNHEDGNNSLIAFNGIGFGNSIPKLVEVKDANGFNDSEAANNQIQSGNVVWEVGRSSLNDDLAVDADSRKRDPLISENLGDADDFYDPQDSLSHASNTEEDNSVCVTYRLSMHTAAMGEFFDAWEELSSDSGLQNSSILDLEEELHEIRASLLMEMEKRKLAEKALANMQSQWQRIRHGLSLVGLSLPACPNSECERLAVSAVEDLSEQVFVARFVADAVGRATARAEVETDMEAQIEAKNFEIARLMDRLHYYEAVNREMSQRNQEAVERARRLRQRRTGRQRWVWVAVATALSAGTAALLWSFHPAGRGPSSTNQPPELKLGMEAEL